MQNWVVPMLILICKIYKNKLFVISILGFSIAKKRNTHLNWLKDKFWTKNTKDLPLQLEKQN